MPRTPAPLTVKWEAYLNQWAVYDEARAWVATFKSEADARAFVVLPALLDLLNDYRQEHGLDGCQRFEQESVGDNAVVEVVDRRCGYCCLADKLLAAADGPSPKE